MTTEDPIGDATYDPDDNKLRLRVPSRLDSEDYAKAKAAGFRWAPKQELFYAHWSPVAEDLLLAWCGSIEDEDTSLADRAEERAERFGGYSERREAEGDREAQAVSAIADNIPLGQPILVGHHSEKRARKDAERIENGMARAVKSWKTAEYWQQRARGVIAEAAYKDRPEVRARRIEALEAERRKRVASYTPHGPEFVSTPSRFGRCWDDHPSGQECEKCSPRPMVMVGNKGRGSHPVPVEDLPKYERGQARWIAHLDRRLEYERALLSEQGAEKLLEKPKRPKTPPLLNYRAPEGVRIRQKWGPDVYTEKQVEMTKAEYQAIYSDSRWTVLSEDKSHRVRYFTRGGFGPNRETAVAFLTDSKEHPKP